MAGWREPTRGRFEVSGPFGRTSGTRPCLSCSRPALGTPETDRVAAAQIRGVSAIGPDGPFQQTRPGMFSAVSRQSGGLLIRPVWAKRGIYARQRSGRETGYSEFARRIFSVDLSNSSP